MQNKNYLRAFVTGTALLWLGTSAIAQISLQWEATLARRGIDRVLRSIEPPTLTHSLLTIGERSRSAVEAALQDPALSNQREAIHALQVEATRALGFYQQLELRRNYDEWKIEALYFLVLNPSCDQTCEQALFQQYEVARRELSGFTESAFLEALETVTPSGLEIWNRRDLNAWREWATHQPVAVAYWLGRHLLELTDIDRNNPKVWFRVPYVLALFETVKEREPSYDHWGGLAYFGLSRWILTPPQATDTSRTVENSAIE